MLPANGERAPLNTPWGRTDHEEYFAPGIWSVSTSSHGGMYLSPARRCSITDPVLQAYVTEYHAGGWFEEDCDWCIAVIAWQHVFVAETVAAAVRTLRTWYPDLYEAYYKVKLKPGESFIRDEQVWKREHANDWQTVSASTHPDDIAKVIVTACIGGRNEQNCFAGPLHQFLVDKDEYKPSRVGSFIIDPARHPEVRVRNGKVEVEE